jgi:Putative auto-transporter adhesin, head GIN domain
LIRKSHLPLKFKLKKMKKLLFSLVTFLSLSAFAQDTKVINDANATQRTLNAGFTAIHVSSGIDLYISQGNEESIAVSASDQKNLDRLKTEVVNGTLKIYYDYKGISWKPDHRKLKAYVSFKTLEKLTASAGSEVTVNGSINAEDLDLNVNSGSEFNGTINAKMLSAHVSSGAGIKISGRADKLKADVSSGANFKGYDFAVDFCEASASSGASLHVTINKELNAKASSGADIRYKGTALIRDIKISAGGAVKKV